MILDLKDGEGSVSSNLDALMTRKNDLVADVEYLSQTVEYQTFQEYTCQRASLFYVNCYKIMCENFKNELRSNEEEKEQLVLTCD